MSHTTKLLLGLFTCASLALGSAACSSDDSSATSPMKDSGPPAKDSGPTPGVDSGPTPGIDSGTTDAGPTLPTGMVDRMGRPAINTALNYADDTMKDSFNHAETFAAAGMTTWDTNFDKNLKLFDTLDGTNQWAQADGGTSAAHPLVAPLKLDVLIVDTGKACTSANGFCEGGYLEIENELLLGGAAHQTCGGRTPAEDVIDKTLSLLAIKAFSGISDGVNAATKPPTRTFPYLAPAN